MKKNFWKFKLLSVFSVLVLALGLFPTSAVYADSNSASLEAFKASLQKTDASHLTGVFVKNILAVNVVQQSSTYSVSTKSRTITQFSMASQYGSIGLVTHNYLSGASFSKLKPGTEITLVYGDGSTKKYQVRAIKKYQALSPTNVYSDYIDLAKPDTTLSSTKVFDDNYGVSGDLVLQTCISKKGISSWGLLFVIASPIG